MRDPLRRVWEKQSSGLFLTHLLHSLNALKTELHSEGRYTDTVDEVMLKLIKAPVKKVKIA